MKEIKWYCYILSMLFIIFIYKDSAPIELPKHPYPYPVITFYEDTYYEGANLIVSPGKIRDLSRIRKFTGGNWARIISSHKIYPDLDPTYIKGPLHVTIYVYSEKNFQGHARAITYSESFDGACPEWKGFKVGALGVGGTWDDRVMSMEILIDNERYEDNAIFFEN